MSGFKSDTLNAKAHNLSTILLCKFSLRAEISHFLIDGQKDGSAI